MSAALAPLPARAAQYAALARSDATLHAYASDWQHFCRWCEAHGAASLPAADATLALYLSDLAATHRPATLRRRMASIAAAHRAARQPLPAGEATHAVMRGIRRAHGTAQRQARPARTAEVRRMLAACGTGTQGLRDRALLLLGFAAALRRSELVALDVADLDWSEDGLTLTVRRSKTDQEGAGQRIGVPYGQRAATCPVRAVRAWLDAAGIAEGAALRSVDRWGRVGGRLTAQAVALRVKALAEAAGLDPARFSGHSLRAGLATAAAEAGASERSIMAQTRHRSVAMVRRYIREGSLFRENAAGTVGL
ncbi:MAG: site-specific integrase [Chloroflexota bacterium]|nr:site-specific integrase [Chloroflexota bacterium]